jgi:hypothetical protein
MREAIYHAVTNISRILKCHQKKLPDNFPHQHYGFLQGNLNHKHTMNQLHTKETTSTDKLAFMNQMKT